MRTSVMRTFGLLLTLAASATLADDAPVPARSYSDFITGQNAFNGWEFLGSTKLTVQAASTAVVAFPARDLLMVVVDVTGYSGADVASLRFNGDSGANYWWRHLQSAAAATTFTNSQGLSAPRCQLAGTAVVQGRSVQVFITNFRTVSKAAIIRTQNNTNAAATGGILTLGGCEWVNTTAQITSIQMLNAGANQLTVGSGFAVFGKNL
jgi:hypothetical protein